MSLLLWEIDYSDDDIDDYDDDRDSERSSVFMIAKTIQFMIIIS